MSRRFVSIILAVLLVLSCAVPVSADTAGPGESSAVSESSEAELAEETETAETTDKSGTDGSEAGGSVGDRSGSDDGEQEAPAPSETPSPVPHGSPEKSGEEVEPETEQKESSASPSEEPAKKSNDENSEASAGPEDAESAESPSPAPEESISPSPSAEPEHETSETPSPSDSPETSPQLSESPAPADDENEEDNSEPEDSADEDGNSVMAINLSPVNVLFMGNGTTMQQVGGGDSIKGKFTFYFKGEDKTVVSAKEEYTVKVKAPEDETGTTISPEEVKVGGREGNYLYFTHQPQKGGTYTVEVSKTDGTGVTGTVELKEITLHAGEGKQFSTSLAEYKTYVTGKETVFSQIYYPEIRNIPGGSSLLGWADSLENAGAGTVLDLATALTKSDLYAVYGEKKTFGFELYNGGVHETQVNLGDTVDLGTVRYGDSVEGLTKTFTVKNTGNQGITLNWGSESQPFGFVRTFEQAGQEIAAEDTAVITIKPSENPDVGLHERTLVLDGENIQRFFFKVTYTVTPKELYIVPSAKEKKYGVSWGFSNIKDELTFEEKDGGEAFSDDSADDLGVVLGNPGYAKSAGVGTYDYVIESTSSNKNYVVELKPGSAQLSVIKDTPVPKTISASSIHVGNQLKESILTAEFVNSNDPSMTVTGTLRWDEPDSVLSMTEGPFDAAWTFTPDAEFNDNYGGSHGNQQVTVSNKGEVTLSVKDESSLDVEYDGSQHAVEFTSNAEDGGNITVEYSPKGEESWSGTAPESAGTYDVHAISEHTDKYAGAEAEAELVIRQKVLSFKFSTGTKIYDGTETVPDFHAYVRDIVNDDDVSADVSAVFESPLAGASVGIRITVNSLSGTDAKNYRSDSVYHSSATIYPAKLSIAQKDIDKSYGKAIFPSAEEFTISGFAGGDSPNVTIVSEGFSGTADVRQYDITAVIEDTNYTFGAPAEAKQNTAVCGHVNVTQAEPMLQGIVTTSLGKKGGALRDVSISASFVNPNDAGMPVEGSIAWSDPGHTLGQESTENCAWTFTPLNGTNYSPVSGSVSVSLSDSQPVKITVKEVPVIKYDGSEHSFDSYVEVEPSASVEITYRSHEGTEVSGFETWTGTAPTDAGTYEVHITALPLESADYSANETVAMFTIEKADLTYGDLSGRSVPKGTALNSEEVLALFKDEFKFNGSPVKGELVWLEPNGIIDEQDEVFFWTFIPESPNFNPVSGYTKFSLVYDQRVLSAEIYNLPENDYAVIDVDGSELKENETVTFYKDAAATQTVGGTVIITTEDIETGYAVAVIDGGALSFSGGTLYGKVSSSSNPAIGFRYDAEPSVYFTLDGDKTESVFLKQGETVTVGTGHTSQNAPTSVSFSVSNERNLVFSSASESASLMAEGPLYNVVLEVTAVFAHPDTVRHGGETVVCSASVPVTANTVFDVFASAGEGIPSASVSEEALETVSGDENIMDAETKEAVERGDRVDVVLSVNKADTASSEFKKAEKLIADLADRKSYVEAMSLDIDLVRYINRTNATLIEELMAPISVTLGIPEDIISSVPETAGFAVIRVHNGQADLLPDTDEVRETVTFDTDKFSYYTIVYQNAPADIDALKALRDEASGLNLELFSNFDAVSDALNEANELLESEGLDAGNQDEIDAAYEKLKSAFDALKYKDVDMTELKKAISDAEALDPSAYIDFRGVESALKAARAVAEREDLDIRQQNLVDLAAAELIRAMNELYVKPGASVSPAPTVSPPDDPSAGITPRPGATAKPGTGNEPEEAPNPYATPAPKDLYLAELNSAIRRARALNRNLFEDFSAVDKALSEPMSIADGSVPVTQEDVDAAADRLISAISALTYKKADKGSLNQAISKAESLNASDYKDFSDVQRAVSQGKVFANDENLDIRSQSKVDAAAQSILDAIRDLVPVNPGSQASAGSSSAGSSGSSGGAGETGENGRWGSGGGSMSEGPGSQNGGPSGSGTQGGSVLPEGQGGNMNPQTGDNFKPVLWVSLAAAGISCMLCLLVVFIRKRRNGNKEK